MTGDEIRWALEHLSIDDRKLKQLGATGFYAGAQGSHDHRALTSA